MGLFDSFGGGMSDAENRAVTDAGGAAGTASRNMGGSRNRFSDLLGDGQDALNTSVSSAMSAAMPDFRKAMQGVQESEVGRGVGLGSSQGSLGTSYEGDLESAFNRNITNAAGSQALGLYQSKLGGAASLYGTDVYNNMMAQNRYTNMLTNQGNFNRKRSAGLFGALGGLAGGLLGGPLGSLGSAFGSELGSDLGSAL